MLSLLPSQIESLVDALRSCTAGNLLVPFVSTDMEGSRTVLLTFSKFTVCDRFTAMQMTKVQEL